MKKIVLILLSFTIFAVNSFAESGNLSKGLKLYDDSKYSQAKPYFEKIVALNNEETGEAYFYLAEIAYFTLAEPKNDVEHERLLRLSIAKDYIPAITHLGGYISDAKEGEKILLAGLEKFPHDESIIEGLTDVYYEMGITDKTVNFYEQLGAKGNSKAYLNLGYLYQDDKQYNLAEENFLKAANNNVEGSKLVLADFYKSQKKYDLAEKYYLEVKAEDSVDGLAELYIIQKNMI
jgi:tetratricopeptide (TPR) repeat protein